MVETTRTSLYNPVLLVNNMEFLEPPWHPWQKKIKYVPYEQDALKRLDIDTIKETSKPILDYRQKKRKIKSLSSMLGYLPPTKKKQETLIGKSKCSNNTAQPMTKSSQTWLQDSTSLLGKVFSPFWTQSRKEMSQKLWSPIETDSLVSESTCLNVHSKNMKQHSTWFRVTKKQQTNLLEEQSLLKTYSPFVTTLWPKTMEGEPLPSLEIDASGSLKIPKAPIKNLQPPVKAIKIKLHPRRSKDHVQLRKIMGTVRWTYNECVRIISNPEKRKEKENWTDSKTGKSFGWKKFLRAKILNKDSSSIIQNPWLQETSYDIRDDACKDVLTAMKGCWTNLKKGNIEKFKLGFKSKKKCPSESFYVRSRWIEQKENTIVLKLPKTKPIKLWTGKRAWKGPILMDCRLQRTWTGDYYLCVPQTFEIGKHSVSRVENQDPFQNKENLHLSPSPSLSSPSSPSSSTFLKVCSLDPGVRTFQTIYDVNKGFSLQVGDRDISGIFRLCKAQDTLIGKHSKELVCKKRYKLKLAIRRMTTRIRNLIGEVHKQLAKYLTVNYDVVLIPSFETSQMIRRADRKISSKTARQMLSWAHYRFRERLLFKCRENGCKAVIVNEAYTSKTCSCCGFLKMNLGRAEIYVCDCCGAVMDRDVNGAKNIFLKNYQALEISLESLALGPTPF